MNHLSPVASACGIASYSAPSAPPFELTDIIRDIIVLGVDTSTVEICPVLDTSKSHGILQTALHRGDMDNSRNLLIPSRMRARS